MEIEGKIIAVLEARKGVSQRTGTEWVVQSYVLETNEQYPKKCVFEIFGADKISQMNIQVGQELRVSIDIDAHEYQGRWFNSIRAWKVEPLVAPVAADPVAPATAPFPAEPASASSSQDDLPF